MRAIGRIAALFGFGFFTLALATSANALPAAEAPVYAIDHYPFQKAPALLRWRSVLQRETHLVERANPDDCNNGQPRLACAAKEGLLLEEKLQDKSPAEQVAGVYAYFNAIKYKEHDPENCGIDCWKSRLQFLAQREGDCGDHALAEYFTLKRLGFKERDLQLIVAQLPGYEDSFKGGHVVLRVRADEEYFILDNRRTELADLSGLRKYKVLAGMNADSVQIYNLVTPEPPRGFIDDATQVAALIVSPGAQPSSEDVQVAAATPAEPELVPVPEPEMGAAKPTLVAAAVAAPAPDAAIAKSDDDATCLQTANLSDWNPFLPCTPTKTYKMVVKAKTIIGAAPPKPVEVAEAPKVPEPKVTVKAPEPKVEASKPAVVASKPEPVKVEPAPKAVAETKSEDDSSACMQGASLADWNPNLPCTPGGNSSSLKIEFKDAL